MTITYKWTVNSMLTVQQPNPNYVTNVAWMVEGTDGTYFARCGNNTSFDSGQASSFIPYDQLTEELVIEWIKSALGQEGVADYEKAIQTQIEELSKAATTPQSAALPWQQGA